MPAWRKLPPVDGTLTPGFNPNLYGQHPVFEITALDSRTRFALFFMVTLQSLYSVNRGEAGVFFLYLPRPAPALTTRDCAAAAYLFVHMVRAYSTTA